MADPSTYRPKAGEIPESPGVYRFRDAARPRRVRRQGQEPALSGSRLLLRRTSPSLHPRTQTDGDDRRLRGVDGGGDRGRGAPARVQRGSRSSTRGSTSSTATTSPTPTWPSRSVTSSRGSMVMRGAKRKGTRYFGPYAHAWAIRETVDLLLRVFPVRTCSNGVFKRAGQIGRPCLLGYIEQVLAPCVGRISEEHRALAEDFCDFMAGQTPARSSGASRSRCRRPPRTLEFERAARLRDDLGALQTGRLEKSAVVLADGTDADVFALAEDDARGRRPGVPRPRAAGSAASGAGSWRRSRTSPTPTARPRQRRRLPAAGPSYQPAPSARGARRRAPSRGRSWSRSCPRTSTRFEELAQRQPARRAGRSVRVPQRGRQEDAAGDRLPQRRPGARAAQDQARRRPDHPRSQALREIQEALGPGRGAAADRVLRRLQPPGHRGRGLHGRLRGRPGRARASTAGSPIKGVDGQNDVASMHEVISRRFRRLLDDKQNAGLDLGAGALDGDDPDAPTLDEADLPGRGPGGNDVDGRTGPATPIDPETGRPRKFAYAPGLVVVDGGPPQVAAAAQRALDEPRHRRRPASAGWPSAWRRSGCPAEEDPAHPAAAPPRASTCFSGCATRPTGSPSPTTVQKPVQDHGRVSLLDDVPGLGRCAARRPCCKHVRLAQEAPRGRKRRRHRLRCRASDPRSHRPWCPRSAERLCWHSRHVDKVSGEIVSTQHVAGAADRLQEECDRGRPGRRS